MVCPHLILTTLNLLHAAMASLSPGTSRVMWFLSRFAFTTGERWNFFSINKYVLGHCPHTHTWVHIVCVFILWLLEAIWDEVPCSVKLLLYCLKWWHKLCRAHMLRFYFSHSPPTLVLLSSFSCHVKIPKWNMQLGNLWCDREETRKIQCQKGKVETMAASSESESK